MTLRWSFLSAPPRPLGKNSSIESMEPMEPLSSGHKSAITQRETLDSVLDQSGADETSRRSNRVRMIYRRSQYCIRVRSPLPGWGCLPACADQAFSPGHAITCLQPRRFIMFLRLHPRTCFENKPRKGLRARRGGWRGATRAHIRREICNRGATTFPPQTPTFSNNGSLCQ